MIKKLFKLVFRFFWGSKEDLNSYLHVDEQHDMRKSAGIEAAREKNHSRNNGKLF